MYINTYYHWGCQKKWIPQYYSKLVTKLDFQFPWYEYFYCVLFGRACWGTAQLSYGVLGLHAGVGGVIDLWRRYLQYISMGGVFATVMLFKECVGGEKEHLIKHKV